MRSILSILLVLAAAVGVLFARSGAQSPEQPKQAQKKLIDLKADVMAPIAKGDSVVYLLGNFAAQHNGAVITCDSAVRHSDMRIEFFGNVLINKNTTYIYGDRAEYDGNLNEARVYSPLIKVVDGEATLYTYQFVFNTKDNIGRFSDGGIMINRDSRLEAVQGYYYADKKELVCVEQVEIRNDEYELKGDSVIYNMSSDNAFFFERTNIWNKDGDYLYGDRGEYHKADSLYIVTRNGYVLTEKQEVWSDSIHYYRMKEHAILRRDIQIDDTEHKVLAFGDYGEYWKTPGNAFLSRRPSVVSYDLSQGDSLFMRADSLYLYTILARDEEKTPSADSIGGHAPPARSDDNHSSPTASIDSPNGPNTATPLNPHDAKGSSGLSGVDSLIRGVVADSVTTASVMQADSVQLTPEQRKAQLKEAVLKAQVAKKLAAAKAKKEKLAEIAAARKEKTTAKLLAQKQKEDKRLAAMKLKAESKLLARQARAARKGKTTPIDSTALQRIDSLIEANSLELDSLANHMTDSLTVDSLALISQADSTDSLLLKVDTMYRLMKGFRNVKIYRSDFQVVCDSMTAISTDSTIHLYIAPVMWNQSNQITSEVMDIFTKNQQIIRAEFVGNPMMVSELDTIHYNQVAGKTMTSYFRDNNIYRNDVNGNAQTIYYMQDGEPPEVTSMGVIESGDCSFYIEDKQVVTITYRLTPEWKIYPLDKIPADQSLYLKDFKWEGARRPTQSEVFDRTIRPSIRAHKTAMPHPNFPIMQRIDDYKKRLMEQRRWTDRNEHVDPPTVEWMRDLGFEVGQPRPEQN